MMATRLFILPPKQSKPSDAVKCLLFGADPNDPVSQYHLAVCRNATNVNNLTTHKLMDHYARIHQFPGDCLILGVKVLAERQTAINLTVIDLPGNHAEFSQGSRLLLTKPVAKSHRKFE